jgi:PST family polysaccharide transporter
VIDQPSVAVRMVNEQTEVALLLAGPVLIAMLAIAPWVVSLLYTSEFIPAADILRWQVMGDILKVASWPLGFILIAAGAGRTYILTETLAATVFVVGTALGLPRFGIVTTGGSFLLMYAVYLPTIYWLCHRRIGMSWNRPVKQQFAMLVALAMVIMALAHRSDIAAATFGLIAAVALGLFGLRRLIHMADLSGPVARLVTTARKLLRRGDL